MSRKTTKDLRRFEFIEGDASRFWEIRPAGDGFVIRYGRIGTQGRTLVRQFPDRRTAAEQAEKLVTERLLDGYQEAAVTEGLGIRAGSLARLEERCSSPALKKAVRIYADTFRPYCLPVFLPFDPKAPRQRLSDQVVGGLPFISRAWPWPRNGYGHPMQFIAQIDLDRASRLLRFEFGSGVLQVWAKDDGCDDFELRILPRSALGEPLDPEVPEGAEDTSEDSMLSPEDMRLTWSPRVEWMPAGPMHYPTPWSRICGHGEQVEVIDRGEVESALEELSGHDDWAADITTADFKGHAGDAHPNVYLGGYPYAAGNGWDLHAPERRMLINLWADSAALWHVAVWAISGRKGKVRFEADVSCTR